MLLFMTPRPDLLSGSVQPSHMGLTPSVLEGGLNEASVHIADVRVWHASCVAEVQPGVMIVCMRAVVPRWRYIADESRAPHSLYKMAHARRAARKFSAGLSLAVAGLLGSKGL